MCVYECVHGTNGGLWKKHASDVVQDLIILFDLAQTEIRQSGDHLGRIIGLGQENIVRFQVEVEDLVGVKVTHCGRELVCEPVDDGELPVTYREIFRMLQFGLCIDPQIWGQEIEGFLPFSCVLGQ